MSTARKRYIVTDTCINCHKEIGATRVSTSYIQEYYDGKVMTIPRNGYNWIHIGNQQGKCDPALSPYYAAGTKRPPQ